MSRAPKKNMRVRYGELAAVSLGDLQIKNANCTVQISKEGPEKVSSLPSLGKLYIVSNNVKTLATPEAYVTVNFAEAKLNLLYEAPPLSDLYKNVRKVNDEDTFYLNKLCDDSDDVISRYKVVVKLVEPAISFAESFTVKYEDKRVLSTDITPTKYASKFKLVKLPAKGTINKLTITSGKGVEVGLNDEFDSLDDVAYFAPECKGDPTVEDRKDEFNLRYDVSSDVVKVVKFAVNLDRKTIDAGDIGFSIEYDATNLLDFTSADLNFPDDEKLLITGFTQGVVGESGTGVLKLAQCYIDTNDENKQKIDLNTAVAVSDTEPFTTITRSELVNDPVVDSPITKLVFVSNNRVIASNAKFIFYLQRTVPCTINKYKVTLTPERKIVDQTTVINVSIDYDDLEPLDFTPPPQQD